MRIHTGDTVVVIAGKDKGKTGSVLRILAAKNRLVIGSINMRTKHVRATPQRAGQKIQYEASIHVSNVMLVDPKSKKRTRIGFVRDEKGKKRVAKRSGEVLVSGKAAKPEVSKKDKATKDVKEDKKVTKEVKEVKEVKGVKEVKEDKKKDKKSTTPEQVAAPTKKPFWKRIVSFGADAAQDSEEDDASPKKGGKSIPRDTSAHRQSSTRGA